MLACFAQTKLIDVLYGKVTILEIFMPAKIIVDGVKSKLHPLHATWSNMRARCNNPNNKDFKFYGEVGIKVCLRWDDFSLFVEDIKRLGPRPKNFTLDRIKSSEDYRPDNIQWSSKSKQARNQKMRVTNNCGHTGVNHTQCGGYIARIYRNGTRLYLGYFPTLELAVRARKEAERELDWYNVR